MLSISVLSSSGFSTTCRTPAMAARRRTAGRGIASNQDDRHARIARLQCAQHRETIHAGHVVIKNKTIGAHQVWMGQSRSAPPAQTCTSSPSSSRANLSDSRTARSSSTTRTRCEPALMELGLRRLFSSRLSDCVSGNPRRQSTPRTLIWRNPPTHRPVDSRSATSAIRTRSERLPAPILVMTFARWTSTVRALSFRS